MLVEKISDRQFVFSFSSELKILDIQRLIDYARYLEATAGSTSRQTDIDALANDLNNEWWNKNKHRFLN